MAPFRAPFGKLQPALVYRHEPRRLKGRLVVTHETTLYLEFSPDVQKNFGQHGMSLEQIVAQSAPEATIGFGVYPFGHSSNRSKSLVLVIVASSAGIAAIIVALTGLLNTYVHRPHYVEWDELEEVTEDGKIVRDNAGNPIWKVKHRQGLSESRASRRASSLDFRFNSNGVWVRVLTDSDEREQPLQE